MARHGYYSTPHWRALRQAALKRDHWRCTITGCRRQATIVDHIVTRPRQDGPSELDRLDNLRSLCATHDGEMKERRTGRGAARLKAVDIDGWPLA
jgi:5-methylcytosine-specific restriction endonuclease McrA